MAAQSVFQRAAEVFALWDGTTGQAREIQSTLVERIDLQDGFIPLQLVGGVDVGFEQGGSVTRAAAVLLDAEGLQSMAHTLVRLPTAMPYVPGLLSFRELPAVLKALEQLSQVTDCLSRRDWPIGWLHSVVCCGGGKLYCSELECRFWRAGEDSG